MTEKWNRSRQSWLLMWAVAAGVAYGSSLLSAQATEVPVPLQGVGITERLGESVSIQNLHFQDETGHSAPLSSFFRPGHPVILALVYYDCPNLCTLLLDGLVNSLKSLDWTPGQQFDVIAVSINAQETPAKAAEKKALYLQTYARPGSVQGWHFLTSEEAQVQQLASQLGFRYRYDELQKQYAHAAAIFVLTPEGRISRYLYGIHFNLKDLRFSLLEASHGKIGGVVDRVLLFCFHFDPSKNSYSLRMWRIVQGVLVIQLLMMAVLFRILWRKDPDSRKRMPSRG
jgi:protein SCO1